MILKVLKPLGIFILGLLLALICAPFIMKDQIIDEVKKKINENINAEVDFKDVDISFIKSFPEVSISINDLKVTGVDTFYHIDLIKAEKINLDFSLLPFFDRSKPMSLKYVGIENGDLDLLVLTDSLANYLITKPNSDTTALKMALDAYELKNSNLTYRDMTLPLKVVMRNVNHKGSGNIDKNVYDLITKTSADSLSLTYDGFTYLKNIKSELDAVFNIDLDNSKFTLKDNVLKLNKLQASGDGFIHFLSKEDMDIQTTFSSEKATFADFLTVMPHLSAYNTVSANGQVTIKGKVNGVLNNLQKKYPAYDVNLNITNGSAQYAGLTQPISNVKGNITLKSSRSDMKDLLVSVKDFNAQVGQEKIAGNFDINNGMTDPHIFGNLDMNIQLANWAKAIPMNDVEKLTGIVNANLKFDARKSDIDKENYNSIKFDGKALVNQINYKIKNKQPILINEATFTAVPSVVDVKISGMKLGRSDANFSGKLLNPMAYFSDIKNIGGEMKLTSNLLDLNEWIVSSHPSSTNSASLGPDLSLYRYNDVDVDFDINKLIYGNHTVEAMKGKGKLGLENVDIKSFTAKLDESLVSFDGKLANVYSYLFNNEVLVGDINLKSNYFDANKYMVKSEATPPATDSILFEVPDRIDLTIHTKLDGLKYTNMEFKNVVGTTKVRDKVIQLSDMKGNILGGQMSFDGLYDTKDAGYPGFNIKLDLAKMEFHKAYQQFVTIKQLAPVANYIQGIFNTTLIFEGNLKKGMIPDFSNITASGFIETINGILKGFKPVQAAADKLGLVELSNLELKDTKNWFDVKKGVVEVKEFTKNIKGIDMKMSGNHKIMGPMNYDMFLRVPRSMLQKNKVTGNIDKGISLIEKEAAKRGLNITQGEFIDLQLKITGSITSPSVAITPLGTSGKTLQEEVKEKVEIKIEQTKDSLQKVIISKTNEIKDSIRSRAEQEVEKAKEVAKEKATEVINDVKDKVGKQVEEKLDSIVGKTVSDSLKRKAEEIIKGKTGKEIEDLKNKVKDWNPLKGKKSGGSN
jgi:hypothetical protein